MRSGKVILIICLIVYSIFVIGCTSYSSCKYDCAKIHCINITDDNNFSINYNCRNYNNQIQERCYNKCRGIN